jgi:RimJ/RimL family protein N-acetyltransferase
LGFSQIHDDICFVESCAGAPPLAVDADAGAAGEDGADEDDVDAAIDDDVGGARNPPVVRFALPSHASHAKTPRKAKTISARDIARLSNPSLATRLVRAPPIPTIYSGMSSNERTGEARARIHDALSIDELSTERLTLRKHVAADFDESAALWADPAVTKYVGGKPSTREESWARLLRNVGHWPIVGYGYWAVREKATGRYVGELGFSRLERTMIPAFGDAPEAGWVLAPWAHGKGFATEAMLAAHVWLEARRGASRTVCMIAPENAPSIRVAEKCGYREYARATYKNEPAVLFERVPAR